jgi:hypothetical protein
MLIHAQEHSEVKLPLSGYVKERANRSDLTASLTYILVNEKNFLLFFDAGAA